MPRASRNHVGQCEYCGAILTGGRIRYCNHTCQGLARQASDPTPEEIAAECAKIRESWGPAHASSHWEGPTPDHCRTDHYCSFGCTEPEDEDQ